MRGGSGQVELPGDAEAVVDPAEPAAEAVVAELHEDGAALGEAREQPLELVLRRRLDPDGEGRREGEVVDRRAVEAAEDLPGDRERGALHRALGAGTVRPPPVELEYACVVEQRRVEVERRPCVALEHEERDHLLRHAVTVGGAADGNAQPSRSATATRWSSTTRPRSGSAPVATTSMTTSSERTRWVSPTAGTGPGTSVRMATPVHPDPVQSSTDRAIRAPGSASADGGADAQSGASICAWSRIASATIGADVAQA